MNMDSPRQPHSTDQTTESDRFFARGVKKLFSLAKTKIRLAREAYTVELRPSPAPLVKRLSGVKLATVDDAARRRDALRTATDFGSKASLAQTTVELMDLIECVKYRFEPEGFMPLMGPSGLRKVEERMAGGAEEVNVLVMDEACRDGVNLYAGHEPPAGAFHVGRVPTTLTHYLAYALDSDVLSDGARLKNTNAFLGRKTLIGNAVCNAINHYGGHRL